MIARFSQGAEALRDSLFMKAFFQSLPRSRAELVERCRALMSVTVVQTAFWAILGSGGGQVIRLLSNLLLTRLLYPEIFGLMAIVTSVMVGLGQISDVGLREGVVNSDRINEPRFMRTAWTLQIIRTGVIAVLAAIFAVPIANMYGKPILVPVLIMISLATFMTGFKSIALFAYDKRLDIKTQMLVDLAVQTSGVVVVLIWAWVSPSIWALVAGQFVASLLDVVTSYVLFTGHNSKLAWDKKAVKKLVGFGKWILISSTISWITVQGDRMILGGFISMAELGMYSLAATWSAIVSLVSVNLSTRVLFPYFRQAIETHIDHSKIHKLRNILGIAYVAICVALALIGHWLIVLLYDDRWTDAGWMLQVLALGQVGRSLTGTLMPFMLASGDSFSQMKFSACSAVILVVSLGVGGTLGGPPGVILALAFSSIASHPIMAIYAGRHGFRCLFNDLCLIGASILICVAGWWVFDAPVLAVMQDLMANLPSLSEIRFSIKF